MKETPYCSSHLNIQVDKAPQKFWREQCSGEGGVTTTAKVVSASLGSLELIMVINYLGCYSNN